MVDTLWHCWEVVESMAGSLNKGSEAAGETRRQNNFFKRQKKKNPFKVDFIRNFVTVTES